MNLSNYWSLSGKPFSILFIVILLTLLSSCSDENPTDAPAFAGVTMAIDVDGGTLSLDNKIHLYVPAGTVSTSTVIDLEEVHSPPSPPDGYLQVGPAFTASISGGCGDHPLALGMDFDYSFLDEFSGKMVRFSRLDGAGQWQPIAGQGSHFPLSLGITVSSLGTFAAHIDTSCGDPGDVLAHIAISTSNSLEGAESELLWSTRVSAEFWNFDQTVPLDDAGGAIHLNDFSLEPYDGAFFYYSPQQDVFPGRSYIFQVPGGAEIPVLDDTLHYFDADLTLTNPRGPATRINREEAFTITWDGAGPQLIWLAFYGSGADGSFVFDGKLRPNTGEFILTPEDLGQFEPGGSVVVFLQRIQTGYLLHEGYHRASYSGVGVTASMSIMLQ